MEIFCLSGVRTPPRESIESGLSDDDAKTHPSSVHSRMTAEFGSVPGGISNVSFTFKGLFENFLTIFCP